MTCEFFMDDTDAVIIKLTPRKMVKFEFIVADEVVEVEVDSADILGVK